MDRRAAPARRRAAILGTVVISGMLAATLLAIFLIPLLFVLVERLARLAPRAAAVAPTPDAERVMTAVAQSRGSGRPWCAAALGHRGAVGWRPACLVGPDYKRPPVTTPDDVSRRGVAAPVGASLGDERW